MTVYAITDTKKGEQGLRLLIFKIPQFAYSLYNFYRATMTIKGTLLLNKSIVKRSVEKNWRFSQNFDGFCDNIESWY